MCSEVVTKEMKLPEGLETVLVSNAVKLPSLSISKLVNICGKTHIKSIQNREAELQHPEKSM